MRPEPENTTESRRGAKFLALCGFLLILQACKHPLAIDGEGDIVDANGSGFGCTLAQFQAHHIACTENDIVDEDYIVDYRGEPKEGWRFVGWEGPCATTSVAPNCRLDAPASFSSYMDLNFAGVEMPTLTAKFELIETEYMVTERVAMDVTINDGIVVNGQIVLELYGDDMPITVANFLEYVDSGFYNDTIFHRSLANWVIQAGGWEYVLDPAATVISDLFNIKTPGDQIVNEAARGISNVRGTISMARAGRDTATSHWFINHADNSGPLDFGSASNPDGYAVFGRVVEGMDLVDAIAELDTFNPPFSSPYGDLPAFFDRSASPITLPAEFIVTINSVTRCGLDGSLGC
jgi:cyclophilin family peptidyl-prolyl cis-trans isomerase